MEVNIQIERRSKTLDQGDRARLGHLVGMARFLDQVPIPIFVSTPLPARHPRN
uniref:Uncharacterized protein n=1 Tax=Proteus mirabilis TaxID=584 RepID=A0A1L5JQI3_PROMI|nr:hypothetical protein [Proteus mirabilis]